MLSIYIFSLVLGGSFLLVSLLGDVFEADADVDADFDVDLADAGDAFDAGDAVDAADAADATDGTAAAKIFSIRGLIYALFGFGAVGSILSWIGGTGGLTTFAAALTGGVLTGGMVTVLFNWLWATSATSRAGDEGYVGLQGSVALPLSEGSPGSVVVERGGRRITLRALPWPGAEGDSTAWQSVVIMEMEKGVARVAPLDEELALEP